ncbi:uncharacterized protein K452DRAFT_306499 [Aplosporella prunicola CBS 121167]|uniref:Uncharacterized protein n=1 Tax=Aplosporella prunicola CBS 121167 TaxID=1176127 RepID=A0A6A6BKS3_9PEZI|nr:uncharacterized protein K452DRAFT_306499 [Aplosporella prunicola CBS 121167]KAF2144720.1 hypothetical protein K452DRAFT_306499 [Aplosporella prunicola CBS 121167]
MDDALSPDALFSPSKARQQRAQANDWQHVETWLSALYPNRPLPTFERNEDTLKALLALAAANECADEEAGLMRALGEEAQREMEQADAAPADNDNAQLLSTIESSLTPAGHASLTAMAELTTTLHAPDTSPTTLAHALIAQNTHLAALTQQQAALLTLRNLLAQDLQYLETTHEELTTSPALAAPPALPRQTADFQRQTKQLAPKLREYEERLAALRPPTVPSPAPSPSRATFALSASPTRSSAFLDRRPSSSTTASASSAAIAAAAASDALTSSSAALLHLRAAEDEALALRDEVAHLEGQVQAYRDLPPQREGARRLVRQREKMLEQLKAERDGRFEALVE